MNNQRDFLGIDASAVVDAPTIEPDDEPQRPQAWPGFVAELFHDTDSGEFHGVAYVPGWGDRRTPHVLASSKNRRAVLDAIFEETKTLLSESRSRFRNRPIRPGEWPAIGVVTADGELVVSVRDDEVGMAPMCQVLDRPTRGDA